MLELAEHDLVVPEVVLTELRRVLAERIRLPQPAIAGIEELLRENEVVPRPEAPAALPQRDPDDRWVVFLRRSLKGLPFPPQGQSLSPAARGTGG